MLVDNLNKYRLILASRSKRRQQLLSESGLKFDVVTREFAETYPEGLNGEEIARYVAREKAITFKNEITEKDIVIAADTIVWCNRKVLGKPENYEDALRILSEISGNTHEVITGVSLLSVSKEFTFSVTTRVTFEAMTDEEIRYYIDMFNPYDKAGAYGIQEWIGIVACSNIDGSYFNVVGLPVQRLYAELQNFIKQNTQYDKT
jgi:septum formation protein